MLEKDSLVSTVRAPLSVRLYVVNVYAPSSASASSSSI